MNYKEAYSYPRICLEKAGIYIKKTNVNMFVKFCVCRLETRKWHNLVLSKTQTCFKLFRCTFSEKLTVPHCDFPQCKYQESSQKQIIYRRLKKINPVSIQIEEIITDKQINYLSCFHSGAGHISNANLRYSDVKFMYLIDVSKL